MSWAWASFHFHLLIFVALIAHNWEIFFAQFSGNSDSITNSIISSIVDTESSAYASALHLLSITKSWPVWLRLDVVIVRFLISSVVNWWEVIIFQIVGFVWDHLRSLRLMLWRIVSRGLKLLISANLRPCWNISRGIFLVTYLLVVLFVFLRIDVGTFWVHWWSFVTSFSLSGRLSSLRCWLMQFLQLRQSSWWQVIFQVSFTVIVFGVHNLTWLNSWSWLNWSSVVSLMLESWGWWLLIKPFLTQKSKINGVIFNCIFSNSWKISFFDKFFNSVHWGIRWQLSKTLDFLQLEFAVHGNIKVSSHAVWSLQSWLVLSLW